jgi:hypothetical protein
MVIYGWMFLAAVMMFFTYFVFWLLSVFFPKKGLESISVAFSYPAILLGIIAGISALLDESLGLNIKLILAGTASLWAISGIVTAYPYEKGGQLFWRLVIQLICMGGAWFVVSLFFFGATIPW